MKIIVIGGGPGGSEAAKKAAALGHDVVIVEEDRFGGTCTNWGCIPTKFLLSAIKQHTLQKGVTVDTHEWRKIQARKKALVGGLSRQIEKNMLEAGILIEKGRGNLRSPDEVSVISTGNPLKSIKGEAIILATGSSPLTIPDFKMDGRKIISSNEALELEDIPKSMIIIGSGPVGMEFSFIFNRLGTRVTLLEALPQILPLEDEDVARVIEVEFGRLGIDILKGQKALSVNPVDNDVEVSLSGGHKLTAEKVLVSIGRRLNTADLGLEKLGLRMGRGGQILVDDYLETSIKNIYAVGDITSPYMLAHVASTQGVLAVENISGSRRKMDYRFIPYAIFISPEVATVGINERSARERNIDYLVGKAHWMENVKARIDREQKGFIKILAEDNSGRILGGSIVGPRASEMIHAVGMAIRCGLSAEEFARSIYIHPSLSESFQTAARNLS